MASDKMELFAREYVKDYNATQAAIRAGYSEKTASSQGSRLLKNPKVLERIKENQKALVESSCLSEEKIIIELLSVYDCCKGGKPVKKWDYDKHEYCESGTYEFDSKGALNALKLLGMHLGMFKQKVELSGNIDDSIKEMEAYFARQKGNI